MSLKTVFNRLSPLAQEELENSLRIEMRSLSKKVGDLKTEREEWSKETDVAIKQGRELSTKYDVVLKELHDTLGLVEALGLVDEELDK
jgi:hypothetical protein